MASTSASEFGINNIPYGIASSSTRTKPQCVTRIADDVIFLAELAAKGNFGETGVDLASIFLEPVLNSFAALPKAVQSKVRTTIQSAYEKKALGDSTENIQAVKLHLPLNVGDFTDFSASANHVQNAAEAILGTRSFPPAFHKYPPAYAGRCSSLFLSGTPVHRPYGQFIENYAAAEKNIIFGPSKGLDYELEIGAVIGKPLEAGTRLLTKDADQHMFGLLLVNDWSARDIQALEMKPLGPFNGKSFTTTLSPWIITLEALKAYETPAPPRMAPLAKFMDDPQAVNYNINLEVELVRGGVSSVICKVGFETMYWTFRHMLAHSTINGCPLRTGDLIAGGTVSGQRDEEHGCLLELTMNGRKPWKLSDGKELRYLEDGDVVRFTGMVGDKDSGIGFGECVGEVLPAKQF
ncbi:fumarylacetoacetate hydrolase FahA [Amniculicola lignicola CBS 123094]|uniref:Fumarylacetoacetase n=1 Tax=Amniculicola lignicola CBS 123094 TaxID=1392246 RepID=A0A6A5WPN4_9PLEO|nr:fumarylacetoacetate hydrolase FahA [Amniculicola lignicola CBS 123094]